MKTNRLLLFFLLGWLACGCSGPSPSATQPVPGASPSFSPAPTASLTRALTPTPDGPARSATEDARQTGVAATNAVQDETLQAAYDQSETAVLSAILATVPPRTFQSFPSPDGQWLAQVTLYDCALVAPGQEVLSAYETLTVSSWTVETQLVTCGGIGAAGLSGLFWSGDSRYFYYTDASQGWPDGGYPWTRPVSRFDTRTQESETLAVAATSPDRQKIAGAQAADLVVWNILDGTAERYPGQLSGQAWINWVAWSPDGRALAYLTQTSCQDRYPCPSTLTRVDLDVRELAYHSQTQLLGLEDTPMLMVTWDQADSLQLMGAGFVTSWRYDLDSGELSQAPVPSLTPTLPVALRPTPTPLPTYPPDPAYPGDVYPSADPLRQPFDLPGMRITGHGCPNLSGVQACQVPQSDELRPVLQAVRSGDVFTIRANSDLAYWPLNGLELRRNTSPAHLDDDSVRPASESPLAEQIAAACGSPVLEATWWVQASDGDIVEDYFLVQRAGHWLVWLSADEY